MLDVPFNPAKVPYILLVALLAALGYLAARYRPVEPVEETQRRIFPEHWSLIAGILTLGAALRLYGADFGLPDPYHPDELHKAHIISRMAKQGTFDPHYVLHPPLLLYLSYGVSLLLKPLDLPEWSSITRYLLAGRLVSVLCGTISIWLVYCIGRRIASHFVAVSAALILAVAPLHVTSSRYMKEDVLFVMFTLACLLAVLKSIDERKYRYLYLSGILAGFSFGSKYTGLLTLGVVLSAPWLVTKELSLRPHKTLLKHMLGAALLMPVGFLLSAPYLLASPENAARVYHGFQIESRHAMKGHLGLSIDPWSQLWMFHLSGSLLPGVSFLVTCAALLGAGIVLRERSSRMLFILGLFVLFYLPAEWARSKPPPQPDRYVLACVPFMALLAAYAIEAVFARLEAKRIRSKRVVQAAMAAALVLFPLKRTIELGTEIRYDTRRQATGWLYNNAPAGTRVLLAGGTVYLPRLPLKIVGKPLRGFLGEDKSGAIEKMKRSSYTYLVMTEFDGKRFSTGKERERALREEIERSLPLVKQFKSRHGSYGFHNPVISLYALKEGGATS